MSKQAIDGAKRGSLLKVDPDLLFLVGRDTDPETEKKHGPEHPLWDERIKLGPDEALVQSIAACGVLQPVIFRKNGDRCEIVVGRRRVTAAREANRRIREAGGTPILVPCYQRKATDAGALEQVAAENEIRLDSDPMMKARQASRMLDKGLDAGDVARAFGVGVPAIKRLLKLMDLSEKVQKAVEEERIAPTAALSLVKLPREKQDELLEDLLKDGQKPTKDKVRAAAGATRGGKERATSHRPGRKELRHLLNTHLSSDYFDNHEVAPETVGIIRALSAWIANGDIQGLEGCGLWETVQDMLSAEPPEPEVVVEETTG